MTKQVLILPGDGIGAEVTEQAERVLRAVGGGGIAVARALLGGAAIEANGEPLPPATREAIGKANAVLLGAVGAPQYDSLPNDKKPEKALLELRKILGVYANLRPAFCYPQLAAASTLKPEVVSGLDILIVRELIGGVYFGEPRGIVTEGGERVGINTMRYSESEITRVCRRAFEAARKRRGRLCSVEKANVLEVSMLWRQTATALAADYPDVELSHMYADNAAMQLVRNPAQFDVVVCGNLFGDILSDIAAMLTGSIGMLPSAALGEGGAGLYEPVHGSAPDIAGANKANPLAAILSAAMMLRYSLEMPQAAERVEAAVAAALAGGARTPDIATKGEAAIGCAQMGDEVLRHLQAAA